MSALIGSLACAALFILFGVLRRGGTGCAACGVEGDRGRSSCSGCPHAAEGTAPKEGAK